ncbi:nucleolar transcription factor 1-B-like [Phymastichus coffea]|uniref:nucleolar transcription factor 1-B-like n=1 Tax=Phymastichus coffea TaxID=108790 RepID=UPI00273AC392|nr:nucleolar transcription factor 1-B-like [Phymastichus coffea]
MDEIERKITKIERDRRVEKEDLEEWMEIERKKRRDVENKVKELEREARNQEIRLRTIEENLKESGKERDEKGAEEKVERKKEKNKRKKWKMESESDESPGEEWDEWTKRILVVKKGPKWEEGAKIEEWFENVHKVKVNHVMELGERLKVEFNSREDRDKIWDLEREIYREGKMSLDEWLSFEERKERDEIVRAAKKVLSACQEAGVVMDIVVENRRMIINGRTYRKRGVYRSFKTNTTSLVYFGEHVYGGHWIGNNGPVRWPAKSPDLNPFDYFYWGTSKEAVYHNGGLNDPNDMIQRIQHHAQHLEPEKIHAATHQIRRRAILCIQQQGGEEDKNGDDVDGNDENGEDDDDDMNNDGENDGSEDGEADDSMDEDDDDVGNDPDWEI